MQEGDYREPSPAHLLTAAGAPVPILERGWTKGRDVSSTSLVPASLSDPGLAPKFPSLFSQSLVTHTYTHIHI